MYYLIQYRFMLITRIILIFCVFFLQKEEALAQNKSFNTIVIEFDYVRANFNIDWNTLIGGEEVHFFTSRPIPYLGWYLNFTYQIPKSKNLGTGYIVGLGYWKTGYWLNWELPYYSLSLDPLKSNLYCFYMNGGFLFYFRFWHLRIVPFVTVPIGFTNFSVNVEGEDEGDIAFYYGLDGGIETNIDLGKNIYFILGYKTSLPLASNPSYEIEKNIELEGKFFKRPEKFYLGIAFKIE